MEDLTITDSLVSITITLPNEPTILTKLDIRGIILSTVDVSNYINLIRLDLHTTNLENLLLPLSTTFDRLTISTHNLTSALSLTTVPNLTYLEVRNNDTTPLIVDLSANSIIETINLTNNDITTIDLTNNTLLKKLNVSNNNLSNLNITQNVLLDNLNAFMNQLASIDLSQNSILKKIRFIDKSLCKFRYNQQYFTGSTNN